MVNTSPWINQPMGGITWYNPLSSTRSWRYSPNERFYGHIWYHVSILIAGNLNGCIASNTKIGRWPTGQHSKDEWYGFVSKNGYVIRPQSVPKWPFQFHYGQWFSKTWDFEGFQILRQPHIPNCWHRCFLGPDRVPKAWDMLASKLVQDLGQYVLCAICASLC